MKEYIKSIATWINTVWQYNLGRIGLILLLAIVALSFIALAVVPSDISIKWNNPKEWAYTPKLAPPDWVAFIGIQRAPHAVINVPRYSTYEEAGITYYVYRAIYNLDANDYPQNIAVVIEKLNPLVTKSAMDISLKISLTLERPDNNIVTLYSGAKQLSELVSVIQQESEYVLFTDPSTTISSIRDLVSSITGMSKIEFSQKYEPQLTAGALYIKYCFSKFSLSGNELRISPLEGTYRIQFSIAIPTKYLVELGLRGSPIESLSIIVVGDRYGYLGTDYLGRDIALGVLYGFPVGLLIGVFAATVSVFMGGVLGVVSGYYGGLVDEVIQRFVDVLGNVPLLPIMILIGAIVQQVFESPWLRLLMIVVVYIAFSWGGTAIITRTMTLSIKAEPFVEAARALGAGSARIVFRHILPNVMPYLFASLVFAVPGAILLEAGLSVLGIYHGLPTWGSILASAEEYRGVAMYAWWWVLPPGMSMALTSFTFIALGISIETIVDPRLRGR